MSRGSGRWQRAILTALEAEPEGFVLAYILDPDTGNAPAARHYILCFQPRNVAVSAVIPLSD